ncbi:hypothetical protein [Aquiflexum gelatinilyticum]|uniref:hypothetical protein n=1 Tax=Aquiflexum gelatinilyticum TaxID=2961943 RepID=UPI00215D3E8F|nr:hypothetical protein [Aquiflexum gelatinilyticum]
MKNIPQIIVITLYSGIILIVIFLINEFEFQDMYRASNVTSFTILCLLAFYSYIIREFLRGDFSKLETEAKRIKEENLILKKKISTLALEKELRKIKEQ